MSVHTRSARSRSGRSARLGHRAGSSAPNERGAQLMASFDPARVTKAEWIGLGAGLLAFIASFLPWFTFSVLGGVYSVSANAWSLGFAAWFPVLLLLAGSGLMLAQQLGVNVPVVKPGWPLVLFGVAVLSLIIILIRWLTLSGGTY